MNDQSIHPDHPSVEGELNNNPSLFLLAAGGWKERGGDRYTVQLKLRPYFDDDIITP
jgi:hypothetical protein